MDRNWIFVVLFGLVIIELNAWNYHEEQLFEGSDCFLESFNEEGICRNVTDCQPIFENLRKKRLKVPICHYRKKSNDFVMCCPLSYNSDKEIKKPTLGGAVKKSSLNLDECIDKYIEYRNPSYFKISVVNGKDVDEGEFQNIVSLLLMLN